MKQAILLMTAIIFLVVLGFFLYPNSTTTIDIAPILSEMNIPDPRSITVTLAERDFTLVDGVYESDVVQGVASQEFVRVFGEPVYGDMDGDGDMDAALLLQFSGGGTGVFYYAVIGLLEGETYRATNTLLLGDRIAPQTVSVADGIATYNYADRAVDEPMSTPPSIGVSLRVQYDPYTDSIKEWVWSAGDATVVTERYEGQVDRVAVTFEHLNYTDYRLTTNGVVRYGLLNTERGYGDDGDATVYILNWQRPVGEQMLYVRLSAEPNTLYLLDSERTIVRSSTLTKE